MKGVKRSLLGGERLFGGEGGFLVRAAGAAGVLGGLLGR